MHGSPHAGYAPTVRLDRRDLLPAGVALGVGLVWSIGLPLENDAVAWDDPIVAGDVIDMGKGGRAARVPARAVRDRPDTVP